MRFFEAGADLAKKLSLFALMFISVTLCTSSVAHPPIALVSGPMPNPSPHQIVDAHDAIETARKIWLSQNPTSGAQYREKWDGAFSATHEDHTWVLRQPGFVIYMDERDGHIISSTIDG